MPQWLTAGAYVHMDAPYIIHIINDGQHTLREAASASAAVFLTLEASSPLSRAKAFLFVSNSALAALFSASMSLAAFLYRSSRSFSSFSIAFRRSSSSLCHWQKHCAVKGRAEEVEGGGQE